MVVQPLKGPFTVEDFHRLAALGVLREDERVELINGQVVEMSPIGERHAATVRRLIRSFTHRLGTDTIVDVQNPIVLDARHQPQPDVTVLRPRPDAYRGHPRPPDVLLVVEVADTSLDYDRHVKLPAYARAGIPEVWLVNLETDRLESYRDPFGESYRTAHMASRGDSVTPRSFPATSFEVHELLPPA